jgi:hypothetical protein
MSRVSRTVLKKAWEHVILSEAKDLKSSVAKRARDASLALSMTKRVFQHPASPSVIPATRAIGYFH